MARRVGQPEEDVVDTGEFDEPVFPEREVPGEFDEPRERPEPPPKLPPKPRPEVVGRPGPPDLPPVKRPPPQVKEVTVPKEAIVQAITPEQEARGGRPSIAKLGTETYFLPGSTTYEMGFRTQSEYRMAEMAGLRYGPHSGERVPKDSIIVHIKGEPTRVTPQDKPTAPEITRALKNKTYRVVIEGVDREGRPTEYMVTTKQADALRGLKDKAFIRQLERLKVIPKEAKVVAPPTPPGLIELGDGQLMAQSDFFELSLPLQATAKRSGFVALNKAIDKHNKKIKEWESKHIIIGNQAMPLDEWNKLDEALQTIALRQGFDAMVKHVETQQVAQNKAIATMDKYKTKVGYDLLTAARKGISQKTMELAGFEKEDIKWANDAVRTAEETGVALPGDKKWEHWHTGKLITDAEFQKLKGAEQDQYRRSIPTARRMVIGGVSTLFFSPTRQALPEVTKEDVSGLEYAVGGAQLAMWGIPFMPKGAIGVASTGAGGILGLNLGRNWAELTPGQRALGTAGVVLVSIPALASVVKTAIPVAVKVPIKGGEVTVWKGIAINGKPIIGMSQSKLRLGAGAELPKFSAIQTGYKPATKIETSLLGTRKALKQMGASEVDIRKVEATLDTRGMFAGKKSPYLDKNVELNPIKSLSQDGVAEVFQQSIAKGKQVERVYGSYTIKAQLDPKLRLWRQLGDIDIQTVMTEAETVAFTKQLANALKKIEGVKNVRISKRHPTLVQTRDATGWHHAVDIHSKAESTSLVDDLQQRIGTTGEFSYGMTVNEPAVSISYPGVGKLKIMRLSESGKRKADAILHFRKTEIAPEPHRVKDIADYYVILRTFKGQKIADEWAKAFGHDPGKLLDLAKKSPPKLTTWELTPAELDEVVTGQPEVAVTIPPAMATKLSPGLRSGIATSTAISPSLTARVVPSSPVSPSPGVPSRPVSVGSAIPSVSPALSPALVRSIAASISVSQKPIPSPKVTPSPVTVPSVKPSVVPSISPKPLPATTPVPSPAPSPKPSPPPSPKPSSKPKPSPIPLPKPSPVPEPIPTPVPTPKLVPLPRGGDEERRKIIRESKGAIAWRQGQLHGKDVWHTIKYPYASEADYMTILGRKPSNTTIVTGPGSAYESVRLRYGKPPAKRLTGDIGFMDFFIEPVGLKKIGIGFTADPKMETTGDITIGISRTPPITERPPRLTRRGNIRITPKRPALMR